MFINLAWISQCIDVMGQNGKMVAEIHMSATTKESFRKTLIVAGEKMPRASKSNPDSIIKFRNIPLVVTVGIPDGAMLFRNLAQMTDSDWIRNAQEAASALPTPRTPPPAPSKNEYYEKSQSPTDIFVNACDGIDDTKVGIAVKVKHNGDVVVKGNTTKPEMVGILQAALQKLFDPV